MSYIHAVLIKEETNNIQHFDSQQYKMQLPSALFGHSPQSMSLKNFLYFFLKKSALKEFLIFSQKSFSCFQESKTFLHFLKTYFAYIFGKVYSEPWHVQKNQKYIRNPSIFRTLRYLELKAYSQPQYIRKPRHVQNMVKHLQQKVLRKQLPSALLSPNSINNKKKGSEKNFLYFLIFNKT